MEGEKLIHSLSLGNRREENRIQKVEGVTIPQNLGTIENSLVKQKIIIKHYQEKVCRML